MNKVELLAPAGDLQRLKTAIHFGADAVYIGGKRFSLRSRASNFDLDDIKEGVQYAHQHHAKCYVTVNIIPHQSDLVGLIEYLKDLDKINVDAVIVASLYIAKLAKEHTSMEVHLSTQLSSTNVATLKQYKALNIDRVVLARECSLDDIKLISSSNVLPIEVFIHGGMCVNVSGRCTLSNYMTARDANRGGCAQSCRWKYHIRNQEGQIISDKELLFSMSSKDLNAVDYMANILNFSITSLKIEGRMKSEYYIATVVGAYRRLIDDLFEGLNHQEAISKAKVELAHAENRPTSDGFFTHRPKTDDHLYGVNGSGVTQEFVGIILEYDQLSQWASVQVRNHFEVGHCLEIFGPKIQHQRFHVKQLIDSTETEVERVYKPMEVIRIKIPFTVYPDDLIRRIDL